MAMAGLGYLGTGALVLLLVLTTRGSFSEAANILLLPGPAHSHVRYFAQVGRPLIDKGHNLYAIINGDCQKAVGEIQNANIDLLTYNTPQRLCKTEQELTPDQHEKMNEMISKPQGPISMAMVLYIQATMVADGMEGLFSDKALFDRLHSLNIDLAIVDGFPLALYNYIIPYKLDVPYVTLSTAFHPDIAGVPDLPSFYPVMMNTASPPLSFLERVGNTILYIVTSHVSCLLPASRDSLIGQYAPEKEAVTLRSLQRGSKLWLVSTDIALDYPRVSLPHIIPIGGLSTKPAKDLPENIAKIADSAKNGLIIVSFGSLIKNLPQFIFDQLLDSFREIKDVTIVWKYNGPDLVGKLPSNIHLLPWLPQNDLLGHPNTRLFITHCGNNGQFEALYHGVPMVGIPVFGDQPYNAVRMQAKGFGLKIALSELNSVELVQKIRMVLDNRSFTDNIKLASKVYRSRPQTARERAAYWIEHVLNFGAGHLQSHGIYLPWYQYWLLDVFCFLFTILAVSLVVLIFTFRYCIRTCCGKNKKEKLT